MKNHMPDDFSYDVFLSYSFKDKAIVRPLAEKLRADGLRVWLDDWEIHPGDNVPAKIEEGLESSRVLVLCMSANAFGSDWASLESGTFRFRDPLNKDRRFIPLRLDDAPIKGSLAQFSYIKWLPEGREQEYGKLLEACRNDELGIDIQKQAEDKALCQVETNKMPSLTEDNLAITSVQIPPISPLLKSRIEEARSATGKHDEENAIHLWGEVRKLAEEEGNTAAEICARLDISRLRLRGGSDLDDVLASLDGCIQDAESVDLGNERSRLLQLLGEAHRLRGDFDKARGFVTSALEHSRFLGSKLDEGYALLALSALEKTKGERAVSAVALNLIQEAYDCFSSVYLSGNQEKQHKAILGFAQCHSWRAAVFGKLRLDDAMAEYARALDILRDLGAEHEWDVADILFQRGDLHARADDPQLAAKDLVAAAGLFEKLGDHFKEAECTLRIAELLDRRGWRRESKEYYESAVAIAMQQRNLKRAAWILIRYAYKLMELREFEEAKSIFSTLLQADWLTSGQRLDVLKNLCLVAMGTGQKLELERHSKAVLDIIDDQIAESTSADARRKLIISKGRSLADLDENDRAVACWRRAIKGFEAANDTHGIIECWFSIGGTMRKMNKPKEERKAYQTVLSLAGDEGDSFLLPMTLVMLAQLDIDEQRFDEAREHLNRAEEGNMELNNPAVLIVGQDLRSKLPPE